MNPIAAWPIANNTAPMYNRRPAWVSISAPAVPAETISPSRYQTWPGRSVNVNPVATSCQTNATSYPANRNPSASNRPPAATNGIM